MILAFLCAALLLCATPAWARLQFVAQSGGDNGNPCFAPETNPRQTIAAGIACLSAGDTLYIRGGTYPDVTIDGYGTPIASGTDFGAGAVTIAGYPGETVTLLRGNIRFPAGLSNQYIIFQNLIVDCAGTECQIYFIAPVHHLRFDHVEMANSTTSDSGAGMITGNAPYIEFLHMKVHGAGYGNCAIYSNQGCYAFYINGHHLLMDDCDVYDNGANGLTLYHSVPGGATDVTDNIIRNSRFYNNGFSDARGYAGNGAVISSGARNQVYNNVFWNNKGSALSVNYNCNDCEIYHNTIANNLSYGMEIDGSVGVIAKNNISYQNGNSSAGEQLVDWQNNVTKSNNLLAVNPLFTNAAARDYSLQAGSPAIDTGAALALVTTDILGIPRPQGAAPDMGAYEFGSGGPGPGPTPGPQALRWTFDEGSGTTVADATGNGYTGTLTASPAWGPGRVGSGAVTMNGTTQYVTTGSLVWTVGQPVTVLLWHKVTAGGATGAFGVHSTIVQDRFGAHLPYSDNVCYWDYGNWQTTGRISVDCTPYLGRWTRFALVSAGTTGAFKAIYINGVLAASAAASGGPTAALTTLDVGRWVNESGTYYDPGSVDDVRLDNRVWSAAEILTEYRTSAMARRHRVSLR